MKTIENEMPFFQTLLKLLKNQFVQYKSRDYIPYSYFFVMMSLIG